MQIPGFEIHKELSRGPLTSVFAARYKQDGKLVLLKVLHPQYARDQEIAKRFMREADVIRRLDHENIVKLYDHGTYRDTPFTVMEYISGWNLRDFVRQYHPLPVGVVLMIFHRFLEALEYAHGEGVLHRDIKPSNILIGKDGVVKLTDFGLAQPQDLSAITEHGNMIGTPGYTAPEILQGQPASVRSDIFSTGVTLYELLAGENPFRGESVAVTIHNIMNRKLTGLSDRRSDVPDWLADLITRLTAVDPALRPVPVSAVVSEVQDKTADVQYPDLAGFVREHSDGIDQIPSHENRNPLGKAGVTAAAVAVLLLIIAVLYTFYGRTVTPLVNPALPPAVQEKPDAAHVEPAVARIERGAAAAAGRKDPAGGMQREIAAPENRQVAAGYADTTIQAGPGGLFINAVPWAYVVIDGVPQDTTPMTDPIMLPAGAYRVALENPSYRRFENKLTIKAGTIDSLNIIMTEKYGYLQVSVVPWGDIYLNDSFIETTPLKSPVRIEEGHYRLRVKNPYFKPHEQEVEIKSGETERIVVYLE